MPPCRARGLRKVAVALGVTRVRDGLDVAQRGLARPDRRPAVRLTGIPRESSPEVVPGEAPQAQEKQRAAPPPTRTWFLPSVMTLL